MQQSITNWQKDIIIGTVLGGSSLIKPKNGTNYYLSMRSKNNLWLNYKMQELEEFFFNRQLSKDGSTYRCNSHCSSVFTDIQKTLYDGKQRVVLDKTLHLMQDIGLAIWLLEAGGRTGRDNKNFYLNTTKLKKEGTESVVKYFNELDWPCSMCIGKDRIRIIFSVDATESYIKTVGHRIPEFMYSKIF